LLEVEMPIKNELTKKRMTGAGIVRNAFPRK
jgi:hypothetical protein